MTLSVVEQRVLGSLIEKEIATPETYPLSLNALQAASNQRSSRDPVMELAEEELRQALHHLTDLGLVSALRDGRVPKWEHRARSHFQLRRDEIAVLCLLLLRGPQTPGELRSRADRLYTFTDLDAVVGTLERLAARTPATELPEATSEPLRPLVAILPRQPGAREARFRHLLGADAVREDDPAPTTLRGSNAESLSPPETAPTLAALVAQMHVLEARVARLEAAHAPSSSAPTDDSVAPAAPQPHLSSGA